MRASLALLAVLFVAAMATPRADEPLDRLLERASHYASDFKAGFGTVVASEDYQQTMFDSSRRPRTRQLNSDVFFVTLDDEGGSMVVRTVRRMDGQQVADADDRVQQALQASRSEARRALRVLADEGARYNLGNITRNFSDPTLALLFVSPEREHRFRFQREDRETINGVQTTRVSFDERSRPTLIRDGRSGASLPAAGALYIADDGRVWQTELRVRTTSTTATLTVKYRRDGRLDMLVPASMDEEYLFNDGEPPRLVRIICHASYSNYRRFETSGRIVQ